MTKDKRVYLNEHKQNTGLKKLSFEKVTEEQVDLARSSRNVQVEKVLEEEEHKSKEEIAASKGNGYINTPIERETLMQMIIEKTSTGDNAILKKWGETFLPKL